MAEVRSLLLLLSVSAALGSYFREAIFMARPSPGGGGDNEVRVAITEAKEFCNCSNFVEIPNLFGVSLLLYSYTFPFSVLTSKQT